MNKPFILLLIVLFLGNNRLLHSQESQQDISSKENRKALTFSFNGLNLAGGLGGTMWIARDVAIRTIVTLSYKTEKDLSNGDSYYQTSVGLRGTLMKHFETTDKLSPYIGAGLSFDYYQTAHYGYKPSRSGGISIPLVIGIEYWLTDHISLSGEQSIAFTLYVSESVRRYSLSNATSALLLSIYL